MNKVLISLALMFNITIDLILIFTDSVSPFL